MRAVIRETDGSALLKMEEVRRPEPAKGEVLIRVRAAAVNPIDWKLAPSKLPLIPGWDVAGEIDQIGEDVQNFNTGDAVFALLDLHANGGYAEYALAPTSAVAMKPETLDFITAASVPMASLTAFQALNKMKLERGSKILIHGAAGAVGSFAVQLAYYQGAEVFALASAGDESYLAQLGAREVISYEAGEFEKLVPEVDAVLDVIGGEILKRSWDCLVPGGILVSTVEVPSKEEALVHGLRSEMVFVHPDSNLLAEVARLIDSGVLKVRVGAVLPLAEAEEAQKIARTIHHRGKVVLQVA